MKNAYSMLFSMASCITLNRFLTAGAAMLAARPLGAISLYQLARISFSPQVS